MLSDVARSAGPYNTDGVQVEFSFDFKMFSSDISHIVVTSTEDSVITELTYTTDFTVTLNADQDNDPGGIVTMLVAPDGPTLVITSDIPNEQQTQVANQSGWWPNVVNRALDRIVMLVQQLAAKLLRAPLSPLDTTDYVGMYPVLDADGNWTLASGTGNDADLRTDLAASGGASLAGWVQSVIAGAFGVIRSVQDKLRDHLDLRDFAGADPTGVADSTTALQRATAEMIASGRPLRISRGTWLFSGSALSTASAATLTDKIYIYGDGEGNTLINNQCVNKKPLFNLANSRFATLRDLTITGNGLTGNSGNGHAIDMTNPGTIGTDAFYPSEVEIDRVQIKDHLGNAVAYGGGTMPACAIYAAGALGHRVDHCHFANNNFGVYEYQSQQPTYNICTFYGNLIAALVNDQCENLRVLNPDTVGDHGIGATVPVTGSLGNLRVGVAGVQSAGGSLVKAGAVTDFFARGAEYVGGKHKNHIYAAFSLNSPSLSLVSGCGEIRQEVDGTCGVFYPYGARIVDNTFVNGSPTGAPITNRYGIWSQLAGGYDYIGEIRNNHFVNGGGTVQGTAIFIDGSAAGGVAQSGLIDGNSLGDIAGSGVAITWASFIRLTNVVGGMAVTNNHAVVGANVTVAAVYDYTGVTTSVEGLVDNNNSYLVASGTVTTGKVLPTDYTGLQRTGYYNVAALTVRGVQVVGARNTGWTAGTGAPVKGAFAAYAGATMSVGYVQAEAQATNDAVKAASQRLLAIEQALTTHGLIGA